MSQSARANFDSYCKTRHLRVNSSVVKVRVSLYFELTALSKVERQERILLEIARRFKMTGVENSPEKNRLQH